MCEEKAKPDWFDQAASGSYSNRQQWDQCYSPDQNAFPQFLQRKDVCTYLDSLQFKPHKSSLIFGADLTVFHPYFVNTRHVFCWLQLCLVIIMAIFYSFVLQLFCTCMRGLRSRHIVLVELGFLGMPFQIFSLPCSSYRSLSLLYLVEFACLKCHASSYHSLQFLRLYCVPIYSPLSKTSLSLWSWRVASHLVSNGTVHEFFLVSSR